MAHSHNHYAGQPQQQYYNPQGQPTGYAQQPVYQHQYLSPSPSQGVQQQQQAAPYPPQQQQQHYGYSQPQPVQQQQQQQQQQRQQAYPPQQQQQQQYYQPQQQQHRQQLNPHGSTGSHNSSNYSAGGNNNRSFDGYNVPFGDYGGNYGGGGGGGGAAVAPPSGGGGGDDEEYPAEYPPMSDTQQEERLKDLGVELGCYGEWISHDSRSVYGKLQSVYQCQLSILHRRGDIFIIPLQEVSIFIKHETPQEERKGPLKPIVKLDMLGSGAQGYVWKCQYQGEDEFIVHKEMPFPLNEKEAWKKTLAQASTIKGLNHDHIVRYLDVFPMEHQGYVTANVIMPYHPENDLLKYINSLREPLSEYTVCSLILQLARAIEYLHSQNPPICHRDIKPDNVLMFDNFKRTMLIDLDVSRKLENANAAQTHVGTMEYMAPEVQRGGAPQNAKTDVWSLGLTSFVVAAIPSELTFESPKDGSRYTLNAEVWGEENCLWDLVTGSMDKVCDEKNVVRYSDRLKKLLYRMLSHNQDERPTATECAWEIEKIMERSLLDGVVIDDGDGENEDADG